MTSRGNRRNSIEQPHRAHPRDRSVPTIISVASLVVSIIAAGAALASAVAAGESAKAATENMRVGQRAYVGVNDAVVVDVSPGKSSHVIVAMENSGRTPALNVVARFDTFFAASAPAQPKLPELSVKPSVSTLLAGKKQTVAVYSKSPLAPESYTKYKEQKLRLYLFGHIKYQDVFGDFHTTTVCAWYSISDKRFLNCPFSNEMR